MRLRLIALALRRLTDAIAAPARLYSRIEQRELGLIAAGVAFFGFLAVFPALAAVIALWGFAADPSAIRSQLALSQDFLPYDAYALLSAQVDALLSINNRDLGWATLFTTGFALWSARAGVAALMRGMNAMHGLPARSGLWDMAWAVVLTVMLVALVLSAMVLAVVAPLVIGFLPLGSFQAGVLEVANLALGLILVVMAIGAIYRLAPNHAGEGRPPLFTRGLLLAVILWAGVSRGLVFYLANFGSYNKIYGSIGAVVALLMWFYLSAYAILLGAAVDAERTARRRAKARQ
ncbi:MAG: YihY/virulence factor BrkB family protein [Gemmobacter sp.]